MRRRRHTILSQHSANQDPGKDLFAYLFLLVMVFSFMLLVSLQEIHAQIQAQNAPGQQEAGQSMIGRIGQDQLGRLVRTGGGLVLEFDGIQYDPVADLDRLRQDGRLEQGTDGEGSTLYLEEQPNSGVLLTEYLEAFINLNNAGVSVAFAESVK